MPVMTYADVIIVVFMILVLVLYLCRGTGAFTMSELEGGRLRLMRRILNRKYRCIHPWILVLLD